MKKNQYISKYKTSGEFLNALKNSEIGSILGDITMEDFKKSGIKKVGMYYYKSQFLDMLKNNQKLDIKAQKNGDVYSNKIICDEFPIKNIDLNNNFGRTMQIESYYFSLLLLNKKVNDFILGIRSVFSIPSKGFSDKERVVWLKQLSKKLYQWKFIKSDSVRDSYLLIDNLISLFINKHFVDKNFIGNNRHFTSFMFFDYLTLNDPFFSISKFNSIDETYAKYGIKINLPNLPKTFKNEDMELHIIINKNTNKEEVKNTIEKAWEEIEGWKKRLPNYSPVHRLKDFDLLKDKWKALSLRNHGFSYKKIANELKTNSTRARKMVSEIKNEIKDIKM